LNIGVVAGMPVACAGLAIANRLIAPTLAHRAEAEIAAFCVVWGGAAVWGFVRGARAWRDMFAATALAFAAIPLVNVLTTESSHLFATLPRGAFALAAVDLVALAFAGVYAWLALRRAPANARVPTAARAVMRGA
jgi:hypothetical protein